MIKVAVLFAIGALAVAMLAPAYLPGAAAPPAAAGPAAAQPADEPAPRAAEREGLFVIIQRLRLVAPGIRPDLQRAELRDAVFDVVKWMDEYVELPMP